MRIVTELNRRNLIDEIILEYEFRIFGRLEVTEFLSRVFDLDNMPSTDHRHKNARGDIWRHMEMNDDWDLHYLLCTYLKLLTCDETILFDFINETVHPVVNDDIISMVEIYNKHLIRDGYIMRAVDDVSGYPIYKVKPIAETNMEDIKNIIFSADGPKPEIVLDDSLSNEIRIVKNEEFCLVYNRKINDNGLNWCDLVEWWNVKSEKDDYKLAEKELYLRLKKSLNEPERIIFDTYYKKYHKKFAEKLPALIPQVYLHYDPYTLKQLNGEKRINRQRMDFLMILSSNERIVIELDGKQHYSVGDKSSPALYSEMMEMDRKLKLWGYDVYRFGGYEFTKSNIEEIIEMFFDELLKKHGKTL